MMFRIRDHYYNVELWHNWGWRKLKVGDYLWLEVGFLSFEMFPCNRGLELFKDQDMPEE